MTKPPRQSLRASMPSLAEEAAAAHAEELLQRHPAPPPISATAPMTTSTIHLPVELMYGRQPVAGRSSDQGQATAVLYSLSRQDDGRPRGKAKRQGTSMKLVITKALAAAGLKVATADLEGWSAAATELECWQGKGRQQTLHSRWCWSVETR